LQAAFIFQSLAVSTTDGGYMHDDDAMQQAWEQELEEFLEWQETFGARNGNEENGVATAARAVPGSSDQPFA
jgi:hypothetical protein